MEKFFLIFVVVFMACSDLGGQGVPVNVAPVIEFDIETIQIEPIFEVTAGVDEPQLIAEYRVYSEGEYFLDKIVFNLYPSTMEEEDRNFFYNGLYNFQVVMDGHVCPIESREFDRFEVNCWQMVTSQEPVLIQVLATVVDVTDEESRGLISISRVRVFKDECTRDAAKAPIWNPSIGAQSGQTSAIIQPYQGFGINWRRTEIVIAP